MDRDHPPVRGEPRMSHLPVAVVTGAGSGIGRELALACAREGMAVVIADVEPAPLDQTQALLDALGTPCLARLCDVAQAQELEALANATWDRWGRVDWLFNNAGVAVLGRAWEATEADWHWILSVNLLGVVHGVRSFVPRMLNAGRVAHVVNTASAAGLASVAGSAVYAASKHAVVGFSECLAKDLELVGAPIGVSVLCPSLLPTGIHVSARNRPTELGPAGPTRALHEERVRAGMAASPIGAADVARLTLEAIWSRRFYVLPHAHTAASVAQRAEKILADHRHIHQENLP